MTRLIGQISLAAFVILAAVPARAQLSTAELNGQVTDSSGAVLPGVTDAPPAGKGREAGTEEDAGQDDDAVGRQVRCGGRFLEA